MSGKATGVVYEGERLVKNWWSAKAEAYRLRERANAAETEARNAEIALSKWILPRECKPNEQIAIWFGDSLIQATAETPVGSYWSGPVIVRLQGPRFNELVGSP